MKHMRQADRLDRELAGLTLSRARRDAILAELKGEKDMKKRQWTLRTTLIAAALCAALAVTALAASPTLRDALEGLLGGFGGYAQTVNGVTVTDQGIQITVVKAIADENNGKYYLEVKDLTGDRLTADTHMNFVAYSAAYDPEKRTLLAEGALGSEARGPRNEDGTATITINEVWGGENFEGVPLPVELLEPDNVLKAFRLPEEHSRGTDDDRVALVPEQTPMELEGAVGFTLSSMGFDEKGRLHIQIKVMDGYEVPEWEFYPGIEIWSVGPSDGVRNAVNYHFTYKGNRYVDYRMNFYTDMIAEEYLPKEIYQGKELNLEGWIGTKERIEGDWELTFPLNILPERTVTVGQTISGKPVETLTLTAMSAALDLRLPENEKRGDLSVFPLSVYLADGSHMTIERGRSNVYDEEGYYQDCWTYPDPVEPEQVTAISVGYWYIPLEGGRALPGRWLTELP